VRTVLMRIGILAPLLVETDPGGPMLEQVQAPSDYSVILAVDTSRVRG